MATTTKSTVDRVFDALGEGSAAVTERVKAGNERAGRVSAAFIREAEWVQQGALDLGRKFANNPTDLIGFAASIYEKSVQAQDRAFDFIRQLVDEVAVASRETRTTAEKVVRAQYSAGQPAVEAVRGLVDRTSDIIRPALLRAAQQRTTTPKTAARRAPQTEAAG